MNQDDDGACVTFDDCPALTFGGECFDDRQFPQDATYPFLVENGDYSCTEFNSCHFTFNPSEGDYDVDVTIENCPPNRAYSPIKKRCINALKVENCEYVSNELERGLVCDLNCLNGGECINDRCICEHGYAGHLCGYSLYPMPPTSPRTLTSSPLHQSCTISGNGNIFTFDGALSQIRGQCEYELARTNDFIVTLHRSFDNLLERLTFTWAANKVYTISPTEGSD